MRGDARTILRPMTTATNELERYVVTGITVEKYQACPGAPIQPGSSCDHCGTGIMYVVQLRNVDDGSTMKVGTTCAEKVGLTEDQVRKVRQERRDLERYGRYAASAAERAEWEEALRIQRLADAETEAARVEVAKATHGTTESFWLTGCRCVECVESVPTRSVSVLVDLATGEIASHRIVSNQYGASFAIDTAQGTVWVKAFLKRRSTLVKKGYTYAKAVYAVEEFSRPRDWRSPSFRIIPEGFVSLDDTDEFGEPIK